jgi:hypothetical protein
MMQVLDHILFMAGILNIGFPVMLGLGLLLITMRRHGIKQIN